MRELSRNSDFEWYAVRPSSIYTRVALRSLSIEGITSAILTTKVWLPRQHSMLPALLYSLDPILN